MKMVKINYQIDCNNPDKDILVCNNKRIYYILKYIFLLLNLVIPFFVHIILTFKRGGWGKLRNKQAYQA